MSGIFEAWKAAHEPLLKGLKKEAKPKVVIHRLSENLLERFSDLPLLSKYDAYQRLMDYWADVMQDDLYLIASDGWVDAAKPRGAIDDKEKKIKETPDLTVERQKYKMDLIPPVLVVARYFGAAQADIEALEVVRDAAARDLDEFIEEHSGDEGLPKRHETTKAWLPRAGSRSAQCRRE